MDGVDTLSLVASIIALLLGIAMLVGGIWQLRRQHVTAKQAVQWRHRMHGLSEDVREGMPPRLTDAFILAGRRYLGSMTLAVGVGLALGSFAILALAFVTPVEQRFKLAFLEFIECFSIGPFLAISTGLWWGVGGMPRQPRGTPPRYRISEFRHWILPVWLIVELLGVSAVCVNAALRVQALPPYTPRFLGDVQPIPWVLATAQVPFLVLVVVIEVVARRIAALPPLALPIDSPIAEPYDRKQRRQAISSLYSMGYPILAGCASTLNYAYVSAARLGSGYNDQVFAAACIVIASGFLYFLLATFTQARVQRPATSPMQPQPSAPSD